MLIVIVKKAMIDTSASFRGQSTCFDFVILKSNFETGEEISFPLVKISTIGGQKVSNLDKYYQYSNRIHTLLFL